MNLNLLALIAGIHQHTLLPTVGALDTDKPSHRIARVRYPHIGPPLPVGQMAMNILPKSAAANKRKDMLSLFFKKNSFKL
jgi:hypothetical protein